MFGPQRQGGGGGEFVNVAGLFPAKNGKVIYGRLEGNSLGVVIDKLIEASDQGLGVVFFVKGAQTNSDRGPTANLSMTISKPQENRPARRDWRGTNQSPTTAPNQSPSRTYQRRTERQEQAEAPPPEIVTQRPEATEDVEFNKFLDSFNNKK